MADIKTKEARSKNMAAIRSKDTKPELYLRKKLFAMGLRYRKNVNEIVGHPDLYFAKYKTALFVNGCFWHRHASCKYAYMPKSNIEKWEKKFSDNIKRDAVVEDELQSKGIKRIVVWECTIKKMQRDEVYEKEILSHIQHLLANSVSSIEL